MVLFKFIFNLNLFISLKLNQLSMHRRLKTDITSKHPDKPSNDVGNTIIALCEHISSKKKKNFNQIDIVFKSC